VSARPNRVPGQRCRRCTNALEPSSINAFLAVLPHRSMASARTNRPTSASSDLRRPAMFVRFTGEIDLRRSRRRRRGRPRAEPADVSTAIICARGWPSAQASVEPETKGRQQILMRTPDAGITCEGAPGLFMFSFDGATCCRSAGRPSACRRSHGCVDVVFDAGLAR